MNFVRGGIRQVEGEGPGVGGGDCGAEALDVGNEVCSARKGSGGGRIDQPALDFSAGEREEGDGGARGDGPVLPMGKGRNGRMLSVEGDLAGERVEGEAVLSLDVHAYDGRSRESRGDDENHVEMFALKVEGNVIDAEAGHDRAGGIFNCGGTWQRAAD